MSLAGLAVALLLPSLSIALSGGLLPAVAYLVAGSVWIVVMAILMTPWLERLPVPGAVTLTVVILVLLALATAFIHPMIDESDFMVLGQLVGATDTDDAADLGIAALLDGRNPYEERTFLGQPLAPLPGIFLLGLPFYVLGNVAFAGVFFLGVFWVLASLRPATAQSATALLLLVLTVSPVVLYEVLTGTDHITDAVAVTALGTAVILLAGRPGCLVAAAALGAAMATRANLALLLVPLVAVIWQRVGRRHSVTVALATGAGFLAVTLPFYLRDPAAFTVLQASGGKAAAVPFGGLLLPLIGCVLGVALWRLPHDGVRDFYRDAFLIQFAVITLATATQYVVGSPVADNFWHYGTMYMVPGALYCWHRYTCAREQPGVSTAIDPASSAEVSQQSEAARPHTI